MVAPDLVLVELESFLGGNAEGLSVGVGEGPEVASPPFPYLVIIPLAAFDVTGSMSDPNENWNYEFQVSSVGRFAVQAAGGVKAARARLTSTPGPDFSAAGYKVTGSVKVEAGPAFEAEQQDKPSQFIHHETYRMMLVPT